MKTHLMFLMLILLILIAPTTPPLRAQNATAECPVAPGTPTDLALAIQNADGSFNAVSDFLMPIGDWLNAGGSPDDLHPAIETSLQDHSGDLGANWRVTVLQEDVSGDGMTDVMVEVVGVLGEEQFDSFIEGAVSGYVCAEDHYTPAMVTSLNGVHGDGDLLSGLQGVFELNGNDRPDLYVGLIDGILGSRGTYTWLVSLYEWDVDQFKLLTPVNENGRTVLAVNNGDASMRADRSLTLQEQWVDRHNPFDVTVLVRRMGEFWLWNPESGLFEMGCVYAVDPPTFRIHAVEDGDLAFACGDYESALAHYNAVFASDDLQGWSSAYNECPDCIGDPDFPPDPVESVNLHVYAGYRKALAYTALGQIDQAEATLDEMEQRRSGIQYVDMARTFLEAYQQSNSLAVGCSAARALTQNFVQELFVAPDIYSFTFGRGYFSQFLDDPDSICPFEE